MRASVAAILCASGGLLFDFLPAEEILGVAEVVLHLAVSAPVATAVVRLTDVAPDAPFAADIDWFVTVVQSMGEAKGLQFFRDLAAGNGISVRKGHTNLTNMVAAGEVPMALTVYNYMPEQLKKKGAPIDWVALQPAVVRANSVGVMKSAKNPASAALFMDYLLGEGQKTYAELEYLPANTKVPSALRNIQIRVVDPQESLDRREKWRKLYDEIILKGAKT